MVPHDPWATDGRENARLMAYCKNFSVKYEDLLNVPRLVTAKTVIPRYHRLEGFSWQQLPQSNDSGLCRIDLGLEVGVQKLTA